MQPFDSESEDKAWLPIQKPEADSSLIKWPNSAEWHAKDMNTVTPCTALPAPKRSIPSPTSEIYSDDKYLVYKSGSSSLKDCSVSAPPIPYEKGHDASYHVSSNYTQDIVYSGPYKPLGAGINEAKATQLGEKQFKASSGSSTAKSSRRVEPKRAGGP